MSFGDQISLIKKRIHIYRYQETVLNRYVIRYLTATRRNKININAGLAGFLIPSFHHHRGLQMFIWLCADSTQIPYASDKIQLFHSIRDDLHLLLHNASPLATTYYVTRSPTFLNDAHLLHNPVHQRYKLLRIHHRSSFFAYL